MRYRLRSDLMNDTRLDGKRILLTQADVMMGPVFRTVLAERGATVIADDRSLAAPEAVVAFVGQVFPVCGGWVPR